MKSSIMIYDTDRECWVVELNDKYYNLHCGESFELIVGSSRIPCRIELGINSWYIVLDDVSLNLRTQVMYTVNI
jgi:hypothetical protein